MKPSRKSQLKRFLKSPIKFSTENSHFNLNYEQNGHPKAQPIGSWVAIYIYRLNYEGFPIN